MSTGNRHVSVIMRTKNSAPIITQVLEALFSQEHQDFDLLVVDSGSTDGTVKLLEDYPHKLIRIAPEDYFPGKVLNMAVEQTSSDVVVFLNSDTVPLSPGTLSRLLEAFEDEEVQAAYARQVVRPDAETWVRHDYARSFPDSPQPPPWITLSLPLAGMRRSAWEQHPFYTDAWASEDTEWGVWAREQGLKIVYINDAVVMHSHNYTLQQLYGRRFVEGEADAFIFGNNESAGGALVKYLVSAARDVIESRGTESFSELARAPVRRLVYHWAYLKGNRHGVARLRESDPDVGVGQQTVLSRHDAADPEPLRSGNPEP